MMPPRHSLVPGDGAAPEAASYGLLARRGRAGHLPPEASLDKPPTKGQVLPGGHPQQDFNPGREGKEFVVCLFC